MRKSRLLGLVAVLVIVAGGAATFAWAQANDATTINACVANENGQVRIVKAGTACRRAETATSWNTTGPQGPAGPAGAAGPAGPQGPAGSSGGGGGSGGQSVIGTIAITGKSGDFTGSPFNIEGVTHEIVSPRDAASGLPTGKRQHKPLTVTAEVGVAAPQLMNAITQNQTLPTIVISLYKPGTSTVGTTITLTNASVADFANQCNASYPNCETASFTYQKITWTWLDSNISASDDWETPSA